MNTSISSDGPAADSFAQFLFDRELISGDRDPQASLLACIDYHPAVDRIARRLARTKCVLICMEPMVVLPWNYSRKRLRTFYKRILVGGVPGSTPHTVPWPQVWPKTRPWILNVSGSRVNRVIMVNSNKMSFIRGELYSLRREAALMVEDLDLYGIGWDSGVIQRGANLIKSAGIAVIGGKPLSFSAARWWFRKQPNWKGPLEDKRSKMSDYRFALVIENSSSYMSEKLFDALFSGCIPIYVGPDATRFSIPTSLLIQVEPNLESILRGIQLAKERDFDLWISEAQDFLSKQQTQKVWSHESVYQRLLGMLSYSAR